jgi:hypothetical protein
MPTFDPIRRLLAWRPYVISAQGQDIMRVHGRSIVIALSLVVIGSTLSPSVATAQGAVTPSSDPETAPAASPDEAINTTDRQSLLGAGWADSTDIQWTTTGDQFGFTVLTAPEAQGYQWTELASLSFPGVETDRWIGNACLTSDGTHFAVVYGPRSFTNDPTMFTRGAYASLVNATTGEQTYLGQGYTLAHFNPGCGSQDQVVLSQFSDESTETRLTLFKAGDPGQSSSTVSPTQLTSAIADGAGILAAAGGAIVRVDEEGSTTPIVHTAGSAYDLHLDAMNGLAFVENDGDSATVKRAEIGADLNVEASVVAEGEIDQVGLEADLDGDIFVFGAPSSVTETLPDRWESLEVPASAAISTRGSSALISTEVTATSDGVTDALAPRMEIEFEQKLLKSDQDVELSAVVGESGSATGLVAAENLLPGPDSGALNRSSAFGNGSATSPVEAERACAVPRNDPASQTLQPLPRQVEWAVDRAVTGNLTVARPANWMNLGMAAYTPQGMFPPRALAGGGKVPAQVLLGILAQESNLWQASKYTLPGVTGNPLVGVFYGNNVAANNGDLWAVDFTNADCGYGVGQITDGMRLAGRERPGETALPIAQQRAIALDYAANIAKALDMVSEKWNQTRQGGLTINDGNAKYIENWFFAIWAYNSGYYPQQANQPWGVGWLNNPANPLWDQTRTAFLDGHPDHASHPQDWPYPEKVLGFAAHSLDLPDSASTTVTAFRTAWWSASDGSDGVVNRQNVKPPMFLFCTPAVNSCHPGVTLQPDDPNEKPGPCLHENAVGGFDLKCWYHGNATWKNDCASYCGQEFIRFGLSNPAEPNGTAFPPNCSRNGLPSNAMIIDNLANATPVVRTSSTCGSAVTTTGTFGFNFGTSGSGEFPSKIDLHQLGGGFNSQFYFAHARNSVDNLGGALAITGTWSLGQTLDSWARVLVHMPDHGAWSQQAAYTVNTGAHGSQTRTLLQRNYENKWVSLGAFDFEGVPTISLSNSMQRSATADRLSGIDDIAWDAVAIVPLAAKPTDFVVALGDSYSSGEGASAPNGSNYYRSSDNNGFATSGIGKSPFQNACHRSTEAWSRKAKLASQPSASIGARSDAGDVTMDYHLLACSSAEVRNVLPYNTVPVGQPIPKDNRGRAGNNTQYGEVSQLDRGFLDSNTTLVTLSIGGNDMGFANIIKECIGLNAFCTNNTIAGDPQPLGVMTPLRIDTDVRLGVITTLQQIHQKAPNAEIVLMGYPKIFESSGVCVAIAEAMLPWLNGVSDQLNAALADAALQAGPHVRWVDPSAAFAGRNLCTQNSAVNGLVFTHTAGDYPEKLAINAPGDDISLFPSQQSFHPNTAGTDLYAQAMNSRLSPAAALPVSATLVSNAATTYYATFRYHSSGTAAMQMGALPGCNGETRIGLRKTDGTAVIGQQHTDSLSWPSTSSTQYFGYTGGGGFDYVLPAGSYAFNGRLVGGCGGTSAQTWSGVLKW